MRKRAHGILVKAGLDITYWGIKIIKAEEAGEFRKLDIKNAANWVTCACGMMQKKHPFATGGDSQPLNLELNHLGCDFCRAVGQFQYTRAARVLIEIENFCG